MLVSIEFTTGHMLVVEGEMKRKRLYVRRFIRIPIAADLVMNGTISRPEEAAELLVSGLRQEGIRTKEATFVLESTAVMYRELTVPRSKPKQLVNFIRQELSQQFSASPDILADYIHIPNAEADKKTCRVLAACVQRNAVAGYRTVLEKAKLEAVGLEIASGALTNFLSLYTDGKDGFSRVICHIGKDSVTTSLFAGTQHVFTRPSRLSPLTSGPFGNDASMHNDEIARSASQMVQFEQSRRTGSGLKGIWLCGDVPMGASDMVAAVCAQPVYFFSDNSQIRGGISPGDFACSVGALLRKKGG